MSQNFNIVISATDKATATVRKINDSISKITRPFDEVGKSFKSLGREIGFDKISGNLAKVGITARDAARGVGSIVSPLAGITSVASVAGVIGLADSVAKLGRNLTYSAQNIGISTTSLQQWRGVALQAGFSSDAMTQSLSSLGKTMEDAVSGRNQLAYMEFGRVGVSLKQTSKGLWDVNGAMEHIADYVKSKKNPQAQAMILSTLGISPELLPLLRQGSKAIRAHADELRKAGYIMSPAQIDSAKQFADQLSKMDISATALKNSIGNALMPALKPLIDQFTNWVTQNRALISTKVAEWAQNLAHWLKGIDWDKTFHGLKLIAAGLIAIKAVSVLANVAILGRTLIGITASSAKLGIALAGTSAGLWGIAAAAAAAVGGLIGYETYEHLLAGTKAGDVIGSGVAHVAAALGVPGAQDAIDRTNGRGPVNHSGDFHPERVRANKNRKRDMASAMQYFMSQGWTRAQAAGIVANIDRESNFRPGVVGDRGSAYGLGQWHKDRQAAFAKFTGHSIVGSSMAEQLAFYNYELTQGSDAGARKAGAMLRKTKSAGMSAIVIADYDERHAYSPAEDSSRAGQAEQIFGAPVGPYSQGAVTKTAPQEVHVVVSAEPGTKAKVKPADNVTASTRVGYRSVGAMA